uniref:Transposase IS30-like HTH domain-containing protein n=1 Tax=Poecilia mexicana TaxID=48701 RepID=A0A3B3WMQ6_9TELE
MIFSLSDFERGRIVELHKQGLSQRAIAAEVGRSETVILHFLNDPKGYGTKKSSGRPKKISPALSRRIRLAVRQDTGRSSTQIKAITGADCSPITIRRHLREKGFRNKKRLQRPRLLQRHKIARLDFARVTKQLSFIQLSCMLLLPGCLSPSSLILFASNENMLTANTQFNFTPRFPFVLQQ